MGIFDGLGRLLAGKPVFVDSNNPKNSDPINPTSGRKNIPQVIVSSVDSNVGHDDMSCDINIHNVSSEDVFLDKIYIMGISKELDSVLRAGEERQFVAVFKGKRPENTNHNSCSLQYRNMKNDYFKTTHNVEFKKEPDGTYSINRIRFVPPIHDI